MKWMAILYDINKRELARAHAPDLKELQALMIKWVLKNGDSIKIIGPLEEH